MQNYVLIYAPPVVGPNKNLILVVLKNKPSWQVDKINLPGGKIEPGESPEDAAVRELQEESGLQPLSAPRVMGTISGSWGVIYCVKINVNGYEKITPQKGETEVVAWVEWEEIKNHEILMPNLRTAIPLMKSNIKDFEIIDEGPDWKSDTHEYKIRVPSYNKSKQ